MNQAAVKTTAAVAGDMAMAVSVRDGSITATSTPVVSSTGTVTRVDTSGGANVTLKAAGARNGISVANKSAAQILYVKTGATANIGAGTESYTVPIFPGGYWEAPAGYTGRIDAILGAAEANACALVTEYTT